MVYPRMHIPGDINTPSTYYYSDAGDTPPPVTFSKEPEKQLLRLDTLAVELLFEIVERMDLKDAMRLRLVSKYFAETTMLAPSIWKRFLRDLEAPLPYSPKPVYTLTGTEVISLCRRAIALEANWNRSLDRVKSNSFFCLLRAYHVAIAPGGRFLVTACHSISGEEQSLALYDLENPHGVVTIAQCPTPSPLSTLKVTWMTYKNRQGLAITWVRELLGGGGTRHRDANVEVAVIYISLSTIETLTKPDNKFNAPPFEMVLCRHWATPWCQISIAEGVLAVGHAPNVIGLYNLETGAKSAIKLDEVVPVVVFPDPCIYAIKLLCDGTVLVIRGESATATSYQIHAFETYVIPEWGTIVTNPVPTNSHRIFTDTCDYDISAMFRRQPTSDQPSLLEIVEAFDYFPTIVISVQASSPRLGVTQYRLYPMYNEDILPAFQYEWPPTEWHGSYSKNDRNRTRTRFLSGSDRSLGFPFDHPGLFHTPSLGEFMVLNSHEDGKIPTVHLPEEIDSEIVQCVTWDESSGKICLSTARDLKIWILDYAV